MLSIFKNFNYAQRVNQDFTMNSTDQNAMSENSYDYHNRNDVLPVSWEFFHGLCKGLVGAVSLFQPDVILAVGRGGFYPGTLMAHMLRTELYPVRLSRRKSDVVLYSKPRWQVKPPSIVHGKRVLIVDEICSTGETLTLVRQKLQSMNAGFIKSAVLYAHSQGKTVPDFIGMISDALILNPWDREIYQNGRFEFHPEYKEALAHQGIQPDSFLLIDAPVVEIAKG